MASFTNLAYDIDSTGHHVLFVDVTPNMLVKNLGPQTCFIGSLQVSNPTGVVDTSTAYPLAPGETVTIPNDDPSTNSFVAGANTASGSARLVAVGVN